MLSSVMVLAERSAVLCWFENAEFSQVPFSQTCLLIVFSKGTFPEVCVASFVQRKGFQAFHDFPHKEPSKHSTDSFISPRCTFPQSSRTTSPMSRSMESMLSSLYGIQLDRRTTTVSDPSATQTPTSFSSVLPLTLQIPLITSRRRYAFSSSCLICTPPRGWLSLSNKGLATSL